jgi:hypothetical protein
MALLPKAIYRFNAILIKIPVSFFIEIKKSVLKFIWKHKRPQITKAVMSKKNTAGGITTPDFKTHYRAVPTKPAWYGHRNKNVHQ